MKTHFLIIIQLLFCLPSLFSQKINISGKVVDEISKQELPNATIRIDKQTFLADNKGLFSIWVEKKSIDKYGIVVSYVGYESRTIKVDDADIFLMIKLNGAYNQLDAVVVSTGARRIIEEAVDNIPVNYPNTNFNLLGFQQTFETINDTDFVSKNDALIKLFVPAYQDYINEIQIQVLQNRSFVKRIDSIKNKLADEHWGSVYDAAREGDFVYNKRFFLDSRAINDYSFSLRGVIIHENAKVYAIDFFMRDSLPGFEGTIFIETSSYAFAGITYYFNQLKKEETEKNINYKDFFTIIQVNFQNINSKWILKNFHGEQHAVKRKLLSKPYFRKAIVDFVTISVDTVSVSQIPVEERILKNAKVSDIAKNVDESKWQPIDSLIKNGKFKKYITNTPLPQSINNQ